MKDHVIKDSELKRYTETENYIEIQTGINSIDFIEFYRNKHILSVSLPC